MSTDKVVRSDVVDNTGDVAKFTDRVGEVFQPFRRNGAWIVGGRMKLANPLVLRYRGGACHADSISEVFGIVKIPPAADTGDSKLPSSSPGVLSREILAGRLSSASMGGLG